ncbi:purine-cytosine permease family protein [Mycobacteroides abscessus]
MAISAGPESTPADRGLSVPAPDSVPRTGRAVSSVIESRGAERVPLAERHGNPIQLLWTWSSPNLEFATTFVGFIGVAHFGLNPLQALGAIVTGNALAAFFHFCLSARGPRLGVPQMALNRLAFGRVGNTLPAAVSALTAGVGWFAVNALSAAFALNALLGIHTGLSLLVVATFQILVAVFGYDMVHKVERYLFPILAVIFAAVSVAIMARGDISAPSSGGGLAGFTLTAAACFGYSAGWNPYAADYTRYFPPGRSTERRVGMYAAAGLFLTTTVLEFVGAVAATLIPADSGNPVGDFTGQLPTTLGALALLAVTLGASAANVINIYSAALSFLSVGVRLGHRHSRALTSAALGATGTAVAYVTLSDSGARYESFLLIVAYWLGPWLGVVFSDMVLHRNRNDDTAIDEPNYTNWAGPIALITATAVSVWLFSNQTQYVGAIARHFPHLGDVTFLAGFLISAGVFAAASTVPQLAASKDTGL